MTENQAPEAPKTITDKLKAHLTVSNIAIYALLVFTVGYLVVLGWLLGHGAIEVPKGQVLRGDWFWKRVKSVSPNELGDALAGAFAPLAFVWLAGTVFIQSRELKAQREDMTATTAFIKIQTEILEREEKERINVGLFARAKRITYILNQSYRSSLENTQVLIQRPDHTEPIKGGFQTHAKSDAENERRELFGKFIKKADTLSAGTVFRLSPLQYNAVFSSIDLYLEFKDIYDELDAVERANHIWFEDFRRDYLKSLNSFLLKKTNEEFLFDLTSQDEG